jgi:hypothetical protein
MICSKKLKKRWLWVEHEDADDCILLRTFIEKGWGGYLAWYIPSDDEEATDEQIDVKNTE